MDKTKSSLLKLFTTKRMLCVFLLGFSSGLPILVVYSSIKLWLKRYGVDLSTIGYISWLALPYSYNFLWAFLFDRYQPFSFGRRKSWLLITQIGLLISFILLGLGNPDQSIGYIALIGGILCFWSASQDVAVDAYRNEILSDEELGLGASFGVYGYRIAMWVSSGFGIWITDSETWNWSFNQMFFLMAGLMAIGIITTLWADEPEQKEKPLKTLKDSVLIPFLEYIKRPQALLILFFIFFYKFGDSFAGSMSRPFYADLGFSNKNIGEIASTLGLISTLIGLFLGGGLLYKLGYLKTLWVCGILQALSTLSYSVLALFPSLYMFGAAVFIEDITSGMGTAALIAFMGSLANKRFTATQYALFASLASLGKTLFAGFAGQLIEFFQRGPIIFEQSQYTGYIHFYALGALLGIPGLMCLYQLKIKD